MDKKRPPRKQLLESGKIARSILEERKIILPSDKSAIDRIMHTEGAPMLPGEPGKSYLPYPWTINAARRIIYDLGRAWQADIKDSDSRKIKGVEFFKFVLEGLNRPKSTISTLMIKSIQEKTYNQSLLSKKETLNSMKRFMVDSFAIAVVVKSHIDVVDFLEWFKDWTDRLLNLWPENIRGIDGKQSIKITDDKKNNDSLQTPSSSS